MAGGKEVIERLFGLCKSAPSGKHEFGKLWIGLDFEHRLTRPRSHQTNGLVERFNGRIEDVLQSYHVRSGEELQSTLHRYVWAYNQPLPQAALSRKTHLHAMEICNKLHPDLFKIQPYYRPRCDMYAHPMLGHAARIIRIIHITTFEGDNILGNFLNI